MPKKSKKRKAAKPKSAKRKTVRHKAAPPAPPEAKSQRVDLPFIEPRVESDAGPFDDSGLSIRQRQFVAAITGPARGNATLAAEMAGYSSDNRNSLAVTACENLRKPNISEAIAHALAAKRMTVEWAKLQLIDLASSSLGNFLSVGDDGEPELDFGRAAAAGAIGQLKEYADEGFEGADGKPAIIKRKIKVHDRTAALGLLLKLHGLLKDRDEEKPATQIKARRVNRNPDAAAAVAKPADAQSDHP